MQIKISTRHGNISDETHQFIEQKAAKLLHFFQRLTMIEVTVDLQDEEHKLVEILVSAEHKHDFVAHERHGQLLTAVENAVAKLEGQLRRYKEKLQDHRRKPSTSEVAGAPTQEEQGEE